MPLDEQFKNTKPPAFDGEWQGFRGIPKAGDPNPPLRVGKSTAEFLKVRGRFSRSTGVEGRPQVQELRLTEILMNDNPFRFNNWLNHDGDNALFVTKRTSTGFAVQAKESKANGTFSYRVVAKRKDIDARRFEEVPAR